MRNKVNYNMRDMVHWELDDFLEHDKVPIILHCDDGDIEGVIEEFTLSWFLWEFHRRYDNMNYSVKHNFSGELLTPKTHLKILESVQRDCYIRNVDEPLFGDIRPFNILSYECYNRLYNFMAGDLIPYMTSISILDFKEVVDHPEIKALNEAFREKPVITPKDVKVINERITDILDSDESLQNNALRRAFKHRLVRINAILQDVAPRGFVTDVDSVLFPKPIRRGYVEGIKELADYAAETRTASQAAMMQKAPMEDAENLNRLLQLSVSRVAHISRIDCRSDVYVDWYVETFAKLKDLHGMYYLNEATGELEAIDPSKCSHLIGDTIKLRTVFGCKHPTRDTICAVCFGQLAVNIYPTDNIGHISAIEFQSNQSQKLLSYKHYTASAAGAGVYIDDNARLFFELSGDVKTIYFKPETELDNAQLTVPRYAFNGFEAILSITNWRSVSSVRMSKVVDLVFTPDKNVISSAVPLTIADENNPVHFTLTALKFLAKADYYVNTDNHYVFDMSGWDTEIPLFNIPAVQFDVIKYLKQIEHFVVGPKSSKAKNKESIISYQGKPIKTLNRLHDLVTTGGPDKSQPDAMPLSHLQVIVLAMSCEDPEAGDFRLPLNRMSGNFPGLRTLMFNSSAGIALAYQSQEQDIFSANSYIGRPRPDHPLDNLLFGDS